MPHSQHSFLLRKSRKLIGSFIVILWHSNLSYFLIVGFEKAFLEQLKVVADYRVFCIFGTASSNSDAVFPLSPSIGYCQLQLNHWVEQRQRRKYYAPADQP